MNLGDRLKAWSEVASQNSTEEDPEVLGGRNAEEFLHEYIGSSYNFKGSTLLAGRRVPSARLRRRREFDLIVCTRKMIHLIEVKNWSGQLRDRGHVWQQIKRGGEIKDHANLLTDNAEKRDVVIEYLDKCGVRCPSSFWSQHLCQKVFFMNYNLRMDNSIEQHPDIISRSRLDEYLQRHRRMSLGQCFVSAMIDICVASETAAVLQRGLFGVMPSQQCEKISKALSEVGTWDRLLLYGTKVVSGDLIELQIGGRQYSRERLLGLIANREVSFSWTRGKVTGLLKAVSGFGSLGKVKLNGAWTNVSPDDKIKFHIVGERTPAFRPLMDIDKITLG